MAENFSVAEDFYRITTKTIRNATSLRDTCEKFPSAARQFSGTSNPPRSTAQSSAIPFRSGPVLLDNLYRIAGEAVAVSQTPKTEVVWFGSQACDPSGKLVADMRMMLRQLKQSSPLYRDR